MLRKLEDYQDTYKTQHPSNNPDVPSDKRAKNHQEHINTKNYLETLFQRVNNGQVEKNIDLNIRGKTYKVNIKTGQDISQVRIFSGDQVLCGAEVAAGNTLTSAEIKSGAELGVRKLMKEYDLELNEAEQNKFAEKLSEVVVTNHQEGTKLTELTTLVKEVNREIDNRGSFVTATDFAEIARGVVTTAVTLKDRFVIRNNNRVNRIYDELGKIAAKYDNIVLVRLPGKTLGLNAKLLISGVLTNEQEADLSKILGAPQLQNIKTVQQRQMQKAEALSEKFAGKDTLKIEPHKLIYVDRSKLSRELKEQGVQSKEGKAVSAYLEPDIFVEQLRARMKMLYVDFTPQSIENAEVQATISQVENTLLKDHEKLLSNLKYSVSEGLSEKVAKEYQQLFNSAEFREDNSLQRGFTKNALNKENMGTLLKNCEISLQNAEYNLWQKNRLEKAFKDFRDIVKEKWHVFLARPLRSSLGVAGLGMLAFLAPTVFLGSMLFVQLAMVVFFGVFVITKKYFINSMAMYDHFVDWAERSHGEAFVWKLNLDKKTAKVIADNLKSNKEVADLIKDKSNGCFFDKEARFFEISYAIDAKNTEKIVQFLDSVRAGVSDKKILGALEGLRFSLYKRSTLPISGKWQRDLANRWFIELKDESFVLPATLTAKPGLYIHEEGGKRVLQINHLLTDKEYAELLNVPALKDNSELRETIQIAYKIVKNRASTEYDKINWLRELAIDKRDQVLFEHTTTFEAPFYVPLNNLYVSLRQLSTTPMRIVYLFNNDSRHIFETSSAGMVALARKAEARTNILKSLLFADAKLPEDILDKEQKSELYSRNEYDLFLQLADPNGRQIDDNVILSESIAAALPADGRQRQLLNIYLDKLHLLLNKHGTRFIRYQGKKIVLNKTNRKDEIYLADALREVAEEYNKEFDAHELSQAEIEHFVGIYKFRMERQAEALELAEIVKQLQLYRKLEEAAISKAAKIIEKKYNITKVDAEKIVKVLEKNINKYEDLYKAIIARDNGHLAFNNLSAEAMSIDEFVRLMEFAIVTSYSDKGARIPYQNELLLGDSPEEAAAIFENKIKDYKGTDENIIKTYEIYRDLIKHDKNKDYKGGIFEALRTDIEAVLRKEWSIAKSTEDFALENIEKNSKEDIELIRKVNGYLEEVKEIFKNSFKLDPIEMGELMKARAKSDHVFKELDRFQQYQVIWEENLTKFINGVRAGTDLSEWAIDEMTSSIRDGFNFNLGTLQGLIYQANKVKTAVQKIEGKDLFKGSRGETDEMKGLLDLIAGQKTAIETAKAGNVVAAGSIKEKADNLARSLLALANKPFGGDDNEKGHLSFEILADKLLKKDGNSYSGALVRAIGMEKYDENSASRHLTINVDEFLYENEERKLDPNYMGGLELETHFKSAYIEIKKLEDLKKEIEKAFGQISDSDKKTVLEELEERLNFYARNGVKYNERSAEGFLAAQSRFKRNLVISLQKRFDVANEVAIYLAEHILNKNINKIQYKDFIKEFYAFYYDKQHHQSTEKKVNGLSTKDALLSIVSDYLGEKENKKVSDIEKEYKKTLDKVNDSSMFYVHRNPPDKSRKHKTNNHNFMYLGTDHFEEMQKMVKVLIKWYRQKNKGLPEHAAKTTFVQIFEDLKKEQMKDTISVKMGKKDFKGVEYAYWEEIANWAKLMDAQSKKVDFLEENTDLADRRRDNNVFVDAIFQRVAKARIDELEAKKTAKADNRDLKTLDLVYKMTLASKSFGEITEGSFALNLDKDNYMYDFCLKPILQLFKPDYFNKNMTGEIINKNTVMIQAEQDLYFTQFNKVQQAAKNDMRDAQNTMFSWQGGHGFHDAAGCFMYHNRKDDLLYKTTRTVLDIQTPNSPRNGASQMDKIAVYGGATFIYGALGFGLNVGLPFILGAFLSPVLITTISAVVTFAAAYFVYPRLIDKFTKMRRKHNNRTDKEPMKVDRFTRRIEYTKEYSAVEDYRYRTEAVKSQVFIVQIHSMIGAAEAEGDFDVVIEVQFPRWNLAHMELQPVEEIDRNMFSEYIKNNHLAEDIYKEYVDLYQHGMEHNKYPMMTLNILKFSAIMCLFSYFGLSVFGFTGTWLSMLFGPFGLIALFGILSLAEYASIMSAIGRHFKTLGMSKADRNVSVTRFGTINGTLNSKIYNTMFSLFKMPFISSEPVKNAVRRDVEDLYLRGNDLAKQAFPKDKFRNAKDKKKWLVEAGKYRAEQFALWQERLKKRLPLLGFWGTVGWFGWQLVSIILTSGSLGVLSLSAALMIFAWLNCREVYWRPYNFIEKNGIIGVSSRKDALAVKAGEILPRRSWFARLIRWM